MTYNSKLSDPRWQQMRLLILQRDGWRCTNQKCQTNQVQLEVHHCEYIYGIEPWEYPADMMVTLCYYCHKKERSRIKAERGLLIALKLKGFLFDDILAFQTMLHSDHEFVKVLKHMVDKFKEK